ncbi:hypothetical protein [Novosphingobium resinovorum]|uniref:hypothetical protein n=1 Tax=Novosphingobium resinovorum TaxID=158500 RepID=UPI002ED325EF|nr:hypothetical protein [Novosphingobium resinovorum]
MTFACAVGRIRARCAEHGGTGGASSSFRFSFPHSCEGQPLIQSSVHSLDRPRDWPWPAENVLLIKAARAWCRARTRHLATQPALFVCLRRFHCEQLIPVIDSLMLLGEQLRERRFMPGTQFALSADETRLLTLFEQAERMDASKEAIGLECAFRLALRSTRMVMKRERMLAGA